MTAETVSRPETGFDETTYLDIHPDVAAAVAAGHFESGWSHYDLCGRAEGRVLKFAGSRKGQLLAGLDVARSAGIEIGALDKPIVKKSDGNIFYVDYADAAYLRDRYRTDPAVDIARIVDVDGIWGANTLADALGAGRHVDYVIASHVVEHVPDLISWLREISSVLVEGGALRLAVPDRRYTFDYTRRESVLADVLDAYLRKARAPLPRQILDFCLNARRVDVTAAWAGPLDVSTLRRDFSDRSALDTARDALENGRYHDVHCWVFTPETFAGLMRGLVELELIDLRCETITETRPGQLEFLVAMRVEPDRRKALASWDAPAFA